VGKKRRRGGRGFVDTVKELQADGWESLRAISVASRILHANWLSVIDGTFSG
jgi:hypothetical protein